MSAARLPAVLGGLLLLAAPLAAQTGSPARTVTLAEAVEAALAADPAAVAAESDVAVARADVLQNTGSFLPSLSASSNYANSSNQRFDQASGRLVSESYAAQLQASWEVFDGGRRFADRRAATRNVAAAEATSVERRYQTILTVKQRYYEAAAETELLAAAGARAERARQQLEFARARLELGTATRSDVLRAELELGNAELAVLDAESRQRSARLALGRLMGVEGGVQPAEGTLPEDAPALPPLAELAARAEGSSPAVRAADARLTARRASVLSSYTSYLPTVRLTYGYDWNAIEFPPDERDWSLRVVASLPLFNGFAREGNVARARAQQRTAQAQARDAALGARVAAEDAAREIAQADRRVEIGRRAVELAREDLRVQEERYRLGSATILDLQTSQVALADAEGQLITARRDLGVAVARLEAVLGAELTPSR